MQRGTSNEAAESLLLLRMQPCIPILALLLVRSCRGYVVRQSRSYVCPLFCGASRMNIMHGSCTATQEHLRIKPVGQVFMTEPTLHDTTFVSKSGLVVSTERPFLDASPMALSTVRVAGVLEIKCPLVLKEAHISSVLGTRAFCLDADCRLRTDHTYYAQVQLQMYVCDVPKADFVIWSPIDCAVTILSLMLNSGNQCIKQF